MKSKKPNNSNILDSRFEARTNKAQIERIKEGMKAEGEKNTISKEFRKLLCKLDKKYSK